MTLFDTSLFDSLLKEAELSPRLRTNLDMRTSPDDTSQRMLNALLPGTKVAIHKHPFSSENVLCLSGKVVEIFYDDKGQEIDRSILCPKEGLHGCVIPKGIWHTVEVLEPSVTFDVKDLKYGEDGTTIFNVF